MDEEVRSPQDELRALRERPNTQPDAQAAGVAETRSLVLEELRTPDGDAALADKIDAGEKLNDREMAFVDSIIMGHGFLIDGKRVAPSRVTIFRWDGQ